MVNNFLGKVIMGVGRHTHWVAPVHISEEMVVGIIFYGQCKHVRVSERHLIGKYSGRIRNIPIILRDLKYLNNNPLNILQ